ncbi:hypothetical protein EIN_172690 [Entamoeba invadens IP1]|uniref:Importin N-terminal domain-containing protein n=1 Tax=Entamoeba invadens IP1 TaxID=370355 RepID=A0A0A1TVU2_ENTIV|nr:hypothetical protein EIN_172690 [Entamoeba invadens IP1]ELP84624.1 hypothetical protein EIN_172690 [Entamoeba invadens IP1]|eukprot:XP_004183970.1 hypothetical protein EIN_172690 [Entamoeba invadens IP1]
MEQLVQLLTSAMNPALRAEAERCLEAAKQQNVEQFIVMLLQVLLAQNLNTDVRMMAGILFKNMFKGRGKTNEAMAQKWREIDDQTRLNTHGAIFKLLLDPNPEMQNLGANIVSNIAIIDLPLNKWPDLMTFLLSDITMAKLKAVVAILEDSSFSVISPFINAIFMASLNLVNQNLNFVPSVIKVFENLVCFKDIMKDFNYRGQIEKFLLTAVQHQNNLIKMSGFQALAVFEELNIEYVFEIQHELAIISNAILATPSNGNDDIIELQKTVMTFWQNVAVFEDTHFKTEVDTGDVTVKVFPVVQSSLIQLVGMVQSQTEEIDSNELCFLAQDALNAMVSVVGTAPLEDLSTTICGAYMNQDWRLRFQAMSVFASMLVKIDEKQSIVKEHIKHIFNLLNDPIPINRATAVYAIAKALTLYPDFFKAEAKDIANKIVSMIEDQFDVVKIAAIRFFSRLNDTETFTDHAFEEQSVKALMEMFIGGALKSNNAFLANQFLTSAANVVRGYESYYVAWNVLGLLYKNCLNTNLFKMELIGSTLVLIENCVLTCNKLFIQNKEVLNATFEIAFRSANASPEQAFMLLGSLCGLLYGEIDNYYPVLMKNVKQWLANCSNPSVFVFLMDLVDDIATNSTQYNNEDYVFIVDQIMKVVRGDEYTIAQKIELASVIGDLLRKCAAGINVYVPHILKLAFDLMSSECDETQESIKAKTDCEFAALYVLSTILQRYNTFPDLLQLDSIIYQFFVLCISSKHFGTHQRMVVFVSQVFIDFFALSTIVSSKLIKSEIMNKNIEKLVQRIDFFTPYGDDRDQFKRLKALIHSKFPEFE